MIKNSKLKIKNYSSGQSLFELVVAIGISALVIVVLVSLTSNALQNAAFSKNESLAGTYAQEATEWLRGQRDANTTDFVTDITPLFGAGPACFNVLQLGVGIPAPVKCSTGDTIIDTNGDKTLFTRQITFTEYTPVVGGVTKNIVEADVTVSWTDSKGLHEVTNATYFADWRQR